MFLIYGGLSHEQNGRTANIQYLTVCDSICQRFGGFFYQTKASFMNIIYGGLSHEQTVEQRTFSILTVCDSVYQQFGGFF